MRTIIGDLNKISVRKQTGCVKLKRRRKPSPLLWYVELPIIKPYRAPTGCCKHPCSIVIKMQLFERLPFCAAAIFTPSFPFFIVCNSPT